MDRKKEKKINIKTKKEKKQPIEKTTSPVVWNPFEIFDNMDRFFMDDPWISPWWRQRPTFNPWSERWLQTDTKMSPLDLIDTGDAYKIFAEVPGVSKKDINIDIIGSIVAIEAKQGVDTFYKEVELPCDVDTDLGKTTYQNGVLDIELRKLKRGKTEKKKRNGKTHNRGMRGKNPFCTPPFALIPLPPM